MWPLSGDPALTPRPSIDRIVKFISPAGWTIVVTSCKTPCVVGSCKVPPTSCSDRDSNPIVDVDTTYLGMPNMRLRHDSSTPMILRMTQDTWVAQATDNESFPCTPFIIETYNVSIDNFRFATEGCVAQLANTSAITGTLPSRYWATTTPVLVATNTAPLTRLSRLQFAATGNVAGLGDAVVRVIPQSEGSTVDLNGSVFTDLVGRVDTRSPVAVAAGLLLPEYTGSITVAGSTRMISMRNNDETGRSVTDWMGSVRTPTPPPPLRACPTEDDLHRTNSIYIYVTAGLASVVVIIIIVLIVWHMRERLREKQQKEMVEKKE